MTLLPRSSSSPVPTFLPFHTDCCKSRPHSLLLLPPTFFSSTAFSALPFPLLPTKYQWGPPSSPFLLYLLLTFCLWPTTGRASSLIFHLYPLPHPKLSIAGRASSIPAFFPLSSRLSLMGPIMIPVNQALCLLFQLFSTDSVN